MPGGTHPPLSVILSWPVPTPDFERRGWGIPIVVMTLFSISIAVVSARLWARLVIQRNAGVDDIFIVAAMIPLLGLVITIWGALRVWGFDRHVWNLTPELAIASRKTAIAIEIFYLGATGCTKVSILLFYRRLASGTISKKFQWAVKICIMCVILSTIALMLAPLLGCRPLNAFWNQVDFAWAATHVEGRDYVCFNEPADLLSASAISIVQDFIACFMPSVLFWKLQLPFRQKVALGALFSVGFFTCVSAVIRIVYIYQIFYTTYDITWVAGSAWLWTGVEATLGVICASIPALKVFFQKFLTATQLGNTLSNSFSSIRNRTRRNGTSNNSNIDKSTRRSATLNLTGKSHFTKSSTQRNSKSLADPDLELGTIAVTCEVEVASAYDDSESRSPQHLNSLTGPNINSKSKMPAQKSRAINHYETPWLDERSAPSSPESGKKSKS